ncbi:phage terminase large subunit family protein [Parachitinimonas caeni]|uniref:Phage terminase large subunit family protein n=1 Tax=Parachitinimonas caeni TaxID=3031301 RepID=A0ABT7DVS0_9NEIS|nr:phage terminase large subunit family protein [Parachitinimonas caeni]MDK2124160.1 phage terminase large subunit family protein [Parachitinimonas caeni]
MSPYADPRRRLAASLSRRLRPRPPLSVSDWADQERRLSQKGSAKPGRWRTASNPPLREPLDCLSLRSPVRDIVLMFPIQFGKTEVAVNTLGYCMDYHPGPVMVALPSEVSFNKWIDQKLQPTIEATPAMQRALSTLNSREAANRREFKDFDGGQLYIEHAGSPSRLKSTSVRTLIVDELDEFAACLQGGDDPVKMLDGRTSAFPVSYQRLYISTPQLRGVSRIEALWDKSDQRRYQVPCPHCAARQPLEWSGLHWLAQEGQVQRVWYVCRDCGAHIDEAHKTAMIAAGAWVAAKPEASLRGYHINGLYYQLGLGPRWQALAQEWLDAQNDPAKLKTFVNDRLAETWEDPAMRAVQQAMLADRALPYPLRQAPAEVRAVTSGVDTQDDRLAVQIVGWGEALRSWVLDYVELPGDPAEATVWDALTELLNRPIPHALGGELRVEATAIDAGGHRTEAVKHYVRQRRIRRPLVIFGAVPNNAPVLSKPKPQDVTWAGRTDKRGVMIQHVGTVAIKHQLYAWLGADARREPEQRLVHFSDQLPPEYYRGLTAETYDPVRNRFTLRRGRRNEALDTWVYAYAATHHPELRLHRYSAADWARLAQPLRRLGQTESPPAATPAPATPVAHPPRRPKRPSSPFAADDWINRL